MRISDWSSDVCSSDLPVELASALAIGQFLCVIGRLPEHNEFLERALAASAGLLIWPANLLASIDRVIHAGQARGTDSFLFDDEDEPSDDDEDRSEEHTSELQSLMRISYAVFCLKKKRTII